MTDKMEGTAYCLCRMSSTGKELCIECTQYPTYPLDSNNLIPNLRRYYALECFIVARQTNLPHYITIVEIVNTATYLPLIIESTNLKGCSILKGIHAASLLRVINTYSYTALSVSFYDMRDSLYISPKCTKICLRIQCIAFNYIGNRGDHIVHDYLSHISHPLNSIIHYISDNLPVNMHVNNYHKSLYSDSARFLASDAGKEQHPFSRRNLPLNIKTKLY
jgi:hypothetical protein